MISWRNPDVRHRAWGIDVYGQAILDALDATLSVAGADAGTVLGFCSGGTLQSMALAALQQRGELTDKVAGFALAVCVLDQAEAGMAAAALDESTARLATTASATRGYLDGRTLAEIFAWLRPNDLIWNYWVNNYLMGHAPKAFDILYWNADSVRMSAAMHRDFMELALNNGLTVPGGARMLGSDIDLGKVDTDTYVVAGIADHLCQWESCYRTTQLLGGDTRFILSTSGHIASMVNPPGNPKASYQTAPENPPEAEDWLESATKVRGTWWEDYVGWLAERTGPERKRSRGPGSVAYAPICDAPGTYVLDR